jgi:hypothetical protein
MDSPGRAFDPGVSDPRKHQLYEMDNAIHDVHEIERLYSLVHQLIDTLDDGDITDADRANGWSESVRLDVFASLRDLQALLASGRKLHQVDSELWRDSLSPMSARWRQQIAQPWHPGDSLPRFWIDRPGPLWDALGRIDRLFNAITCSDQMA